LRANFKQLKHFLPLSATAGRFASSALVDDKDWQNAITAVRFVYFFIIMLDKSQPNQGNTEKKQSLLQKNKLALNNLEKRQGDA